MGGSAYAGEQKYPEVGSRLSMLKVLSALDENTAKEAIGREMIIDEQAIVINELEKNIMDLLEVLKQRA